MTRKTKGEYRHLELFDSRDWGLIIYDEVHLLPAPVFRMTADLQSRRRLGLTATLVREDGREGDVFSLIGPKRYDAPWRDIEPQGWIAPAECIEVRVTLTDAERMGYAVAGRRGALQASRRRRAPRSRWSSPSWTGTPASPRWSSAPTWTSSTSWARRWTARSSRARRATGSARRCTTRSAAGEMPAPGGVSKVANFSIDLPEASVAVQVSGTFGSRQEEAQRLGRLLRPKGDGRQALLLLGGLPRHLDTDYAAHRQRFLAEQGYAYRIVDADDLLGPAVPDVG